jgi:hypothetical protein
MIELWSVMTLACKCCISRARQTGETIYCTSGARQYATWELDLSRVYIEGVFFHTESASFQVDRKMAAIINGDTLQLARLA